MVRVIAVRDPTSASLDECVDALCSWGFDPGDEESLAHASHWLGRLGNDRHFIGDRLLDHLGNPRQPAAPGWAPAHSHQLALAAPENSDFRLLATIWEVPDGGTCHAGYGQAHDHAADVVTLGYFGPGCLRDHFEHEEDARGRSKRLRPAGQLALGEGCMLHYRARRDVHRLHPPASLSISLTLVHNSRATQGQARRWFQPEIGGAHTDDDPAAGESLLRAAVALGGEAARASALHVAQHHASESLRLCAWRALAEQETSAQARDAIWKQAEQGGNHRIAAIARQHRAALR
ncbi:transposase [Novosphingobium colocasiae]|uniref:Uncharacterized protein n=1 Tax=Novosphingobium colocasiae TaxID=1256513 RepID=A0A918P9W2_9SPHN|nr:transposase [Novosphingobium colocasiae]GGY93363.1 hypothetical protein GCM10011614_05400 [Novosphingobium colocasiae]